MYCAFVDYEKAFDTVALWFKLVNSGVSCKMVKSLYSKVLAVIKLQTDISSFFLNFVACETRQAFVVTAVYCVRKSCPFRVLAIVRC